MAKFSLMFVGDVHLGRSSLRLPHDLEHYDIDPQTLSPAAALKQAMQLAAQREVKAVVFAGDLIDEMNDMYGAFGHMQAGLKCLTDEGIEAYAVAGNHDFDSLPRLARQMKGLYLLGAGGVWETKIVQDAVQLVGWSFPTKRIENSPLKMGFDSLSLSSALPALGVLHCDLDSSSRSYAPVSHSELRWKSALNAWFLGHIHTPSPLTPESPIGYLGSLMGLDPGERGAHGPWIVTVGDGKIEMTHEPMAPLRWEEIVINDSATLSTDDPIEIFDTACKKAHNLVTKDTARPRVVGCRIRLQGRSDNANKLRRALEQNEVLNYRVSIDGVLYFVDKVFMELQSQIDLESKAAGHDPVAILARHLLTLERGGPAAADLIMATRIDLQHELGNMAYFQNMAEITLTDEKIRELLLMSGRAAIEKMLPAQEVMP